MTLNFRSLKLIGNLHALFFIFLLFGIQASTYAQDQKEFSLLEIKEDFDFARMTLYEVHPRPFQWFPKDSFEIMWNHAETQLYDGMTAAGLSQLLYPMFKKLGCGHSRVYQAKDILLANSKKYKKGAVRNQIPFNIKSISGKTYVNKYLLKDSLISKGDQIISINDLPIEKIKKQISMFISSDGLNQTHIKKSIDKNFIVYFHRAFNYSDTYKLQLMDSLGVKKSLELNPYLVSKAIVKQRTKDKKKQHSPISANIQSSNYKTLLKKDRYRFLRSKKDTSVVIIKIPSFKGKAGKKLYKKAYKIIKADKSIKNLVIDLRGNGGGDAAESWFLTQSLNQKKFETDLTRKKVIDKKFVKQMSISRLGIFLQRISIGLSGDKIKLPDNYKRSIIFEPQKKHRYDGKLFVLIDGYSFSASAVVSSYLKDSNRAIFIGEETGGGMYGTNAMQSPKIALPNTSVQIKIGLWALDQIVNSGIPGRGIFPDHTTTTTLPDFLNGTDVEMEKVYELINTNN